MDAPTLRAEPQPVFRGNRGIRVVPYSDFGVGKTTLGMTFPRPLIINSDDGLVSVTSTLQGPDIYLGEEWEPDGYRDLEGLAFWIKRHLDRYDTLMVDSGDELIATLMGELVELGHEYDTRNRKDVHPVAEFVPELAEYLGNQKQMQKFLKFLRSTKKHVVITMGIRMDEDRPGREVPDAARGIRTLLGRFADVMGKLIVVTEGEAQGKRALMLQPDHPKYVGKTRFSSLLPYVLDPTFEKLMAAYDPVAARAADAEAL